MTVRTTMLILLLLTTLPCLPVLAAETSAEPAATAPAIDAPAKMTTAQELESCMELWDPTTHITKSHWKTICKRLGVDK